MSDNPFQISHRELYLQRLNLAAQRAMAEEGIYSAVNWQTYQDHMARRLIIALRTEVLAEKVLTDSQTVPWSGTVKRTIPVQSGTRLWWLPLYVVAPALAFVGTLTANLWTVTAALVVLACTLAVTLRNPPQEAYKETLPVSGEVTVSATYWRKFPKATVQYPPELGDPIRYVIMDTPYWEENDDPNQSI